jgi:hypothetical protein
MRISISLPVDGVDAVWECNKVGYIKGGYIMDTLLHISPKGSLYT